MSGVTPAGGGTASRRVAGVVVAVLVAAAIAAGSRVPFTPDTSADAMLRLSWTARPERIEDCRTVGAEELAELPAHMRQPVVCEGVTARYRVDVLRDGLLLATDELRGGGLRSDRQLYHHRELRVPSGRATFEVRVTRTHPDGDAGADDDRDDDDGDDDDGGHDDRDRDRAARDDEGRQRRRGEEIPPSLVLTESVTLEPREVMLVLYDRTTRQLRAVRKD